MIEDEHFHEHEVPTVGRPKGAEWESLAADGIVHEAQVVILGAESGLAARLILTTHRLALVAGGTVILEVPRSWLRPAPSVRPNEGVALTITAPSSEGGGSELLGLRMRGAAGSANELVALISGRNPRWTTVEIGDAPAAAPRATRERLAPLDLMTMTAVLGADASGSTAAADRSGDSGDDDFDLAAHHGEARWPGMRSDLLPRGMRRSRWTVVMPIAAVLAILVVAAAIGAGRIGPQLPSIGMLQPHTVPAIATLAPSFTELQVAAKQTAVAAGVGGATGTIAPVVEGDAGDIHIGSGSTETWVDPTAAPPDPAIIAAVTSATPEPATATATPAVPTETPVPPTATMVPVVVPTDIPVEIPTETPTAAPTEVPTLAPTETTAPEATAVPALAYAVRLAEGGSTLPAWGLPPAPNGNWMVVVVDVANTGGVPTSVQMADFMMLTQPNGATVGLDPGADVAAMIAGIDPAYPVDAEIALAPGEATRLVLLFMIDPTSSDMSVVVGDQVLPIAEALRTGLSVGALPSPSVP